jgi:hypothetical protein
MLGMLAWLVFVGGADVAEPTPPALALADGAAVLRHLRRLPPESGYPDIDQAIAVEISPTADGWTVRGTTRWSEDRAGGWTIDLAHDGSRLEGPGCRGYWGWRTHRCGGRQADPLLPTAVN